MKSLLVLLLVALVTVNALSDAEIESIKGLVDKGMFRKIVSLVKGMFKNINQTKSNCSFIIL